MKYIVAAALLLLVATPALAQQVEIQKPSPPTARDREPNLITPGLSDQTRPSDADQYPRGGLGEHDPAFIGPLASRRSTPTSTGRVGIAGWVSPKTPAGSPVSGCGEVSGYRALWFSLR